MHTYIHTYTLYPDEDTELDETAFIHIHMDTYIHTHIYTWIHTYKHTYIHMHTYVHTYIHTYRKRP